MSKLDAILALDEIAENYRVEVSPILAANLALALGDYNDATGERLSGLIEEIDGMIPVMKFGDVDGRPKPNNGRTSHPYCIGREYSRVLYLKIIRAYIPIGFSFDLLSVALRRLGRKYHANEYSITDGRTGVFEYRFWWD